MKPVAVLDSSVVVSGIGWRGGDARATNCAQSSSSADVQAEDADEFLADWSAAFQLDRTAPLHQFIPGCHINVWQPRHPLAFEFES